MISSPARVGAELEIVVIRSDGTVEPILCVPAMVSTSLSDRLRRMKRDLTAAWSQFILDAGYSEDK